MIELLKLLGYIIPIVVALVGLYKFARSIEKRFDNIDDHFKSLDRDLKENTLMTLKKRTNKVIIIVINSLFFNFII